MMYKFVLKLTAENQYNSHFLAWSLFFWDYLLSHRGPHHSDHRHLSIHDRSIKIVYPSAAAAKSCQLCPTLCDPTDGSPPGSSVHGILQARILVWVAISF